jgi:signal transduction histidine kinase
VAQNTTSDLTEEYGIIDRNGNVTWSSAFAEKRIRSEEFSSAIKQPQFPILNETNNPFLTIYGNPNNASNPTILVSYPIIHLSQFNKSTNASYFNNYIENLQLSNRTFANDIVFATINSTKLTKLFESLFNDKDVDTLNFILDDNGFVIYSNNKTWQEKQIISSTDISKSINTRYNEDNKMAIYNLIRNGLFNGTGEIKEIKDKQGKESILTHESLILDNRPSLHVIMETPLGDIQNVQSIIFKQNQFTLLFIVLLGSLALSLIVSAYIINNKLKAIVKKRTKELDETVESLERANKELKVNDKLQKDFINIAAHELRTPTQAIIGYSEMALESIYQRDKNSNYSEYISTINRNASRLYDLIEKILDVAKIESSMLHLNKEPVDICQQIGSMVEEYCKRVKEEKSKDVDIEFIPISNSESPLIIKIDRLRIDQVMTNLLNNALKATEDNNAKDKFKGKIEITVNQVSHEKSKSKFMFSSNELINSNNNNHADDYNNRTVYAKDFGKCVIVSISDSGKGIRNELLPKLFTKFVSFSEKGSGLGLYISKGIVEAHGGKIWARNKKDGQGAIFEFSLPL